MVNGKSAARLQEAQLKPVNSKLLIDWLVSHLAPRIKKAPDEIDINLPLSIYEIDQSTAAEIKRLFEDAFGISIPLASFFNGKNISTLGSECLAHLLTSSHPDLKPSPKEVEVIATYPLSVGQEALWFLQRLNPKSTVYSIVRAVQIPNKLDIPAFRQTFIKLSQRHPMLRTTFNLKNGEPVQQLHPYLAPYFAVEDASNWSMALIKKRLNQAAQMPFDLERGPLLRIHIFSRTPEEHYVLFNIHHIIADLWTLAIFLTEMGEIYDAEKNNISPSLSPHTMTYFDFVQDHFEMLKSSKGKELLQFWRNQLSGELPVLDLPTDYPRPPVQTYQGASQADWIDAERSQQLSLLAKNQHTNLYTILLAAFHILLYRYTGQEDIIVGTPKAGRRRKTMKILGYFVNPVAIRADLSGNPTFPDFLKRMHHTVQQSFAHEDLPFSMLVKELQPERDSSRSPIFQVVFSLQKTTRSVNGDGMALFSIGEGGGKINFGSIPLVSMSVNERVSPFDLSLLIAETSKGLALSLEYNTALLKPDKIRSMLEHYQNLLKSILTNPDQRISALSILTEKEYSRLIINEWNITEVDFPKTKCTHQIFEEHAAQNPDWPAVVFQNQQLTYRELNERANQLAHYLSKLGVGPEQRIALCVERSLEMIIGIMGILKAGGAYVPLDPAYPKDRIAFMLEDVNASILLTQQRFVNELPRQAARIICLDTDWENIAKEDASNLQSGVTTDNLAYMIYTSGSTGQPKGVMLCHNGLCNLATYYIHLLKLDPSSRVLQFFSYSFDGSVADIFMSLLSGATLVVVDKARQLPGNELTRFLREQKITSAVFTPSTLAVLPAEGLSDLQTLASGGESTTREIIARWAPGREYYNVYGPTEATVIVTTYLLNQLPKEATSIPIGKPIHNTKLYVLNYSLEPVPVGIRGELYIGGIGLARGYHNRPDLTAEKFVPNPFSQHPGERLYKTGDLARYLPDGNIEFLGRIDHQVKVRGFRIEVGEIETVLSHHEAIDEAIVQVKKDRAGGNHLVAYLVSNHKATPGSTELRQYLKEKLPEYMLPGFFIPIDTLPLTPNGKLDRKALPEPQALNRSLELNYVKPRTEIERTLAKIWQEVLHLEKVGLHDNFFELGGHSLAMVKIHERLCQTLKREISIIELFKYPTISELTKFLNQEKNHKPVFIEQKQRANQQRNALNIQKRRMMMNRRNIYA